MVLMNEFIQLFLLFFGIYLFIRLLTVLMAGKKKEVKPTCPPHKWVYKKQPGTTIEYMQCEKCGMFPGGSYGEDIDA